MLRVAAGGAGKPPPGAGRVRDRPSWTLFSELTVQDDVSLLSQRDGAQNPGHIAQTRRHNILIYPLQNCRRMHVAVEQYLDLLTHQRE